MKNNKLIFLILSLTSAISFANTFSYQEIYSFLGGVDGLNLRSNLTIGENGDVYGATMLGGNSTYCEFGCGTIFKIDATTGIKSTIYNFQGSSNDGALLFAGVTFGPDGYLYGTTSRGGLYGGGTLFKIDTLGHETILKNFNGINGFSPQGDLVVGPDNDLYGTTEGGGVNGFGSIFKLSKQGVESDLYYFKGTRYQEGKEVDAELVTGSDGYLYGTTYHGGKNGTGTIFKIDTQGHEQTIYQFTNGAQNATNPAAGLLVGPDGDLYGTTSRGGNYNFGTVFKVDTNGNETTLYSFKGYSKQDGGFPIASLVTGPDGDLYGTTSRGGLYGGGTVFEITTTGLEKVIYNFPKGCEPSAKLAVDSKGNLYGTTYFGGVNNAGLVFKLNKR